MIDMKPEEQRIRLYSKEFVYVQEPDSCDPGQMDQEVRISTEDAGGGSYIILKTDRWAIDRTDIDDFCKLLRSVLDGLE